MSLNTNVTGRVSDQLLIELTNQGDISATSVKTSVLDFAVADAQGEFLTQVGKAYDDSDSSHVPVGVDGVMYYLTTYTGQVTAKLDTLRTRFFRGMGALATTQGAERRVLPQTTSTAEPSTERSGRRPDHDRERWGGFVPNAPHPGDLDDLRRR